MNYVLWIGMYDSCGFIKSNNWKIFMKWVQDNCESINLISDLNEQSIYETFKKENISSFCELEDGHNSVDLICNKQVTDELMYWDYCIDQHNISYLFFTREKTEIASIQINDYDCFVVFDCELNVLNEIRDAIDHKLNEDMCEKYKEDIESLIEQKQWKTL